MTTGTDETLVSVTMDVCRFCLDAIGDECHTPGCMFWCQPAPKGNLLRLLVRARWMRRP